MTVTLVLLSDPEGLLVGCLFDAILFWRGYLVLSKHPKKGPWLALQFVRIMPVICVLLGAWMVPTFVADRVTLRLPVLVPWVFVAFLCIPYLDRICFAVSRWRGRPRRDPDGPSRR